MSAQLGRSSQAADEARNSDNDQIKIVALQSLFQANQDRAMTFVYEILQPTSTSSAKVKEGAIKLLGRYHDPSGGERATRLLMEIALNESNQKLRKFAIYSLGRGEWSEQKFRFEGDDQIVPILQKLALSSVEREIASSAIDALNHIANHHEDPRIRAALMEIGINSPSRDVRQKAASRIGEMAEKEGVSILPDLVKLFDANDDRELKKHIISVISKMENPEAQDHVIKIAGTAKHPELRKRAVYVIGQRGSEVGVVALGGVYAAEQSDDVKNQILHSLNETKHRSGLVQLMEIARTDPNLKMRMKAVNYLGRNKDPDAQRFLEELLK
ncbi:MAG: HEAT repeat domain-containing protein [Candidatus Latescibacteria bacterium]|nr:HEAT repeat domain-containing protein [Candidatus Latescibacterota bacterium]